MNIDLVVFDLGGVLIDWNPRYLYRQIFDSEDEVEHFLGTVCTNEWNVSLDAGRTFADAIAERQSRFPAYADAIAAYQHRWLEMISGAVEPTVGVLRRLEKQGRPMIALTNWSSETFALVRHDPRFDFLNAFERIFVSGELKMVKPDPAIFRHLLTAMNVDATRCFFIDDSSANIASARSLGFNAHHFVDAAQLERDLTKRGLLSSQDG